MLTVQQVDNTNSVIQRKGFADFAHSTHLIELKYKFCNRFRSFEQRKMFWSIRVETKTRLVNSGAHKNFKVSNVAVDLESLINEQDYDIPIWVKADGYHTLLATLNRNTPQAQIDVAFGGDQNVEFYIRSKLPAAVYLSGYYIFDDGSSDSSYGEKEQPGFQKFKQPDSHQYHSAIEPFQKINTTTPKVPKRGAGHRTPLVSTYEEQKPVDNFDFQHMSDQKQRKSARMTYTKTITEGSDDENDSFDNDFSTTNTKSSTSPAVGPNKLTGGVIVEDIKHGNGATVKEAATVKFNYSVSLKGNNIRSTPSEVEIPLGNKRKSLPCWSIGIPGMRVGGMRHITSPAEHAYGSKGIPPFIPGDADVVFNIELISTK